MPADGGPLYNRLIFESSPYLSQHATNPVEWYPWGEEAIALAKAQNKPIFLSIGYATCHWCHVMERESFQDKEVAALLNAHFISIKVDREERPDIDEIYMMACQMTSKSCGWPLTSVLTPALEPFFVGSYFPKQSAYGRPGMMELLPRIHEAWTTRKDELVSSAGKITEAIRSYATTEMGELPEQAALSGAYRQLAAGFDNVNGGFGGAPKFPSPHNLTFLLRYSQRSGDKQASHIAAHTLRQMHRGGIYDQVGFGFHRYSTDDHWLVPHFEKMLYDQALIVIANLEAYQATGDPEFAQVAREVLTYVLRDMTAPEGGFYSAEDADSEGVEGKFYLWQADEIVKVLGKRDAAVWNKVYNIRAGGNFQEPGGPDNSSHNIPHLSGSIADSARELGSDVGSDVGKLTAELAGMRQKLFLHREKRVHPFKDDKILTDWNGLMIAALARAGRVLGDDRYTLAAQKAAAFIDSKLVDGKGRLLKRYRAGHAGLPAHIDDYAFMIWGLLELYQTNFNPAHLARATQLAGDTINLFWDGASGGFFLTASDGESLIARSKTGTDGALPSGNSVMALNLIMLNRLTTNEVFGEISTQLLRSFSGNLNDYPRSATFMLQALDFQLGPSHEVGIAGDIKAADTRAMLKALRGAYLPTTVVLHKPLKDAKAVIALAPFVEVYKPQNNRATAFVCQNFSCKKPTNDPAQMLRDLGVPPLDAGEKPKTED